MLHARLADPSLSATERAFLEHLAPAFTELADTAEDTLYVDGAARLLGEHRVQDLAQINELMSMLERRVSLLRPAARGAGEPDVLVRIGAENEAPGAAARWPSSPPATACRPRKLGTVSVIGPVRMDYAARDPRPCARPPTSSRASSRTSTNA